MPLLAPVTMTILPSRFVSTFDQPFAAKRFSSAPMHIGPRLLEVRLVLRPVVAGAVAEVAQRDLGAVVGERLEVQVHQRAQLADHRNIGWRIPFEHELLHRLHAVHEAAFAAARTFRSVDAEPEFECATGHRFNLRRFRRPEALDAFRRRPRLPYVRDRRVDDSRHGDIGRQRLRARHRSRGAGCKRQKDQSQMPRRNAEHWVLPD